MKPNDNIKIIAYSLITNHQVHYSHRLNGNNVIIFNFIGFMRKRIRNRGIYLSIQNICVKNI